MFEIQVAMNDLYGRAYFTVKTQSMDIECIKRAIEEVYDKWSEDLSHQGAGAVQVSWRSYRVATGSIIWWWSGSHTLRLEPIEGEVLDRILTDHTVLSDKADVRPACCALV